jgi:hypothetical protein
MRCTFVLPFLFAFISTTALADIAAIHSEALPQEPALLAALDDVRRLEPFVSVWTNNWKYPVGKREAADRLEKDLGFISASRTAHSDNLELALLTGLVAHYAYNLDVPGSHDKAIAALEDASKLAANDFRVTWFHADLLCQTKETGAGALEFLALETAHPWDQLPAGFWVNYMYCATVTNMPAHVLRAATYLERLHAPGSETRTFLAENAAKRFDAFDPSKKYDAKETWQAIDSGDVTGFTSTLCGVRFNAASKWQVAQLGYGNGSCVAVFSTGPYEATTRDLRPSVLLLVQRPAEGETLKDYVEKFRKNGTYEAFVPSRCPTDTCIALSGIQPGMYKADGDGHGHFLAFERAQPEFPGLIFESPIGVPETDAKEGPQFFRPGHIQQRIPGKLFYLVLVDMAASIEAPAMADYDLFLKNLVVE